MDTNKYLEKLLDKPWDSMNGGDRSAARMYGFYKSEGFLMDMGPDKLVSGWSESVSEQDAEDFVKVLKDAGIRESYVISDFSNQLRRWLALDKAGLKLCGVCEINDPNFAADMKRFGMSSRAEKFPALKFTLGMDCGERDYIYRVTETNVDGCGGSATLFVRFPTALTEENFNRFQKCLEASSEGRGDLDTEDMVRDACTKFEDETGIPCEICNAPYEGAAEF